MSKNFTNYVLGTTNKIYDSAGRSPKGYLNFMSSSPGLRLRQHLKISNIRKNDKPL